MGSDMAIKPNLGGLGYAMAELSWQGKFVRIEEVAAQLEAQLAAKEAARVRRRSQTFEHRYIHVCIRHNVFVNKGLHRPWIRGDHHVWVSSRPSRCV